MRNLFALFVASLASVAVAADQSSTLTPVLGQPVLSTVPPSPVPDQAYSSATMPAPIVVGTPIALYSNVKYKDQRNIHPCAVSKIVQIADPCNPACCIAIEICVPPCACECVSVSKCGTRVKYDYGKYEVEITSRRGRVTVDYDD